MKICNHCKIKKELTEFNKNKNKIDGLQKTCRTCTKKQHIKWYKNNSKIQTEKNKKVRLNKKNEFYNYKKTLSCKKCGNNKHYNLDFHHLDPNKKNFEIGGNYLIGKEKLLEEIQKCIVLCRNCHSEFHYFEKLNKITIQEYLNISLV